VASDIHRQLAALILKEIKMSVATILSSLTKLKPVAWVLNGVIKILGSIKWKLSAGDQLSAAELSELRNRLATHYYILVSQNKNHFSSYLVSLGNFFLTGKWSFWGHVFMNLEDGVSADTDFRFVEAVSEGVKYSTFEEVFACNAVALLKPKAMKLEEFTAVLDKAAAQYAGRPYDNLFDLASDSNLSCVELIRDILKQEPNYETDFANLEAMIAKRKNLTPQMFYDCEDFMVTYEIRK
jgi:hypothetical protein